MSDFSATPSTTPESIFVPGDIIEIPDISHFAGFEDIVATDMEPDMTEARRRAWEGRVALRDSFYPKNFNGRIVDIQLEVLADPYERLMDARERGWRFLAGFYPRERTNEFVDEAALATRGFAFTGQARSSRADFNSEIQAELWFVPAPRYAETKKDGAKRASNPQVNGTAGASIIRYVTKPKVEEAHFATLNVNSRLVALDTLRRNLRNPILSAFHY